MKDYLEKIERDWYEFYKNHITSIHYKPETELDIVWFLRAKLQEAADLTLTRAIEAMPEEHKHRALKSYHGRNSMRVPDTFADGFNECRDEAIARLQALRGKV